MAAGAAGCGAARATRRSASPGAAARTAASAEQRQGEHDQAGGAHPAGSLRPAPEARLSRHHVPMTRPAAPPASDVGSWFPVPAEETLPDGVRGLFRKSRERLGFVPNVFRAYSFRPERLRTWFAHFRRCTSRRRA